jgi:hypothetical protein
MASRGLDLGPAGDSDDGIEASVFERLSGDPLLGHLFHGE